MDVEKALRRAMSRDERDREGVAAQLQQIDERRAQAFSAAARGGMSYRQIGQIVDLTFQRVSQIIRRQR